MKKQYILQVIVVLVLSHHACSIGGEDSFWKRFCSRIPFVGDKSFYVGQRLTHDLKVFEKQLKEDVQEVIKTAVEKQAEQITANALKGALEQLPPEKQREIGYNIGKGLVEGAAAGVAGVTAAAGQAVVAKATATTTAIKVAASAKVTAAVTSVKAGAAAVAASPATPIMAGAVVIGGVTVGGYYLVDTVMTNERDKDFSRCLNTHFRSDDLNDREFPKRCESPERRLAYWNKARSQGNIDLFKNLRRTGGQSKSKEFLM